MGGQGIGIGPSTRPTAPDADPLMPAWAVRCEAMATGTSTKMAAKGSTMVLLILASGQFLMTLDASVMNVSIRQVAADVGTTVVGIQTAITLYTLVMASLMITG